MITLQSEIIENNNFYLYCHIREDTNEVFYVGIGGKNKKDNGSYLRASSIRNRNIYWVNITNKTSYKTKILLHSDSWEEICKKEKEFIKLYGRKDLGLGSLVNFTNGGEGGNGIVYSEDRKKLLSERAKVQIKKQGGIPVPNKELRNLRIKIAKLNTSYRSSDYTKELQRKAKIGKPLKEETKHKMSLVRKGKYHGKILPQVIQLTKSEEIVSMYDSIYDAAKKLNLNSQCIRRVCTGVRKNYNNYKWKYKL